jgi:hypothetical protein
MHERRLLAVSYSESARRYADGTENAGRAPESGGRLYMITVT